MTVRHGVQALRAQVYVCVCSVLSIPDGMRADDVKREIIYEGRCMCVSGGLVQLIEAN